MGTRSNVVIQDGKGRQLVRIYRQYDGYPEGIGADIKEILNNGDVKLLNGFSGQSMPEYFNGIACMGAYLIGKLKDDKIGNVYLDPRKELTKEDSEIEYEYILFPDKDIKGNLTVFIRVIERGDKDMILFQGSLKQFKPEEK